jgi:hypothetical protein
MAHTDDKSTSLTYITPHFPGLVQALQLLVEEENNFIDPHKKVQ